MNLMMYKNRENETKRYPKAIAYCCRDMAQMHSDGEVSLRLEKETEKPFLAMRVRGPSATTIYDVEYCMHCGDRVEVSEWDDKKVEETEHYV